MSKRLELSIATLVLAGFALWFGFDLYTQKRFLNHPEYVHYYHSFRIWFLDHLKEGKFPLWNPHWGIGHTSEIEASFPLDIYTPLELLFGPKYPLFQFLQIVLILGAGLWGFTRLGATPIVAAMGTVFFFLSPWVTYFYFYFIKSNSFIGLLITFPLTHLWFTREDKKLLPFVALATAFTLFGTKLDFWFFHCIFFFIFSLISGAKKPKALAFYWAAFALGILCHAWQIVPLYQILHVADRLGDPPGISAFSEMTWKVVYSLAQSEFVKMFFVSLLALTAMQNRGLKRLAFGLSAAAMIWLFSLWRSDLIHGLASPFGLGAAFAAICLFKLRIEKALFYFLPLAFYWCRPFPGDVNELTILHSSPALFQAVAGFLLFIGCRALPSSALSRKIYAAIIVLFFLRDQGQIILSYLFGLVWIPTRDNFLFDFLFAALGVLGLMQMRFSRQIAGAAIAGIVLSAAPNFYYSHPLIAKTPEGFPFYHGHPDYKAVMEAMKKDPAFRPESRVSFPEPDMNKNLPMHGAALFTGVNQVGQFSSFISKRYHDWTVYHWLGIPPEAKWSTYEGEYTPQTIEKLPLRNTMGIESNQVYWWALHAMPPAKIGALRFLGVHAIITRTGVAPSTELEPSQKIGDFFVTKIKNSLPRAFLIKETNIQNEIDFGAAITVDPMKIPALPAQILKYETDKVAIETNSTEPTRLVLTDLYHPFWKVSVDGKGATLSPALHLFRSVALPPGRHHVEFYCEIPFFLTAVGLSLLAFVFMVYLIARETVSGTISLWEKRPILTPQASS